MNGDAAYLRAVPSGACVGAILNPDEPSYLLYGPKLEYHLEYFSGNVDPLVAALRQGLFYVVISTGSNRSHADEFRRAGWRIRQLGGQWLLASEPDAKSGTC